MPISMLSAGRSILPCQLLPLCPSSLSWPGWAAKTGIRLTQHQNKPNRRRQGGSRAHTKLASAWHGIFLGNQLWCMELNSNIMAQVERKCSFIAEKCTPTRGSGALWPTYRGSGEIREAGEKRPNRKKEVGRKGCCCRLAYNPEGNKLKASLEGAEKASEHLQYKGWPLPACNPAIEASGKGKGG